MEINANNPVGNPVQGLETTSKISEVRREKEEAPERHTAQAEENPDYRINLSAASKQAVAELTDPANAGPDSANGELSENAADQLARQTSVQLAQTDVGIANQAIAKAVDLFT